MRYTIFEPDIFFFVFNATKSQQFYERIIGKKLKLVYSDGEQAYISIEGIDINQFGIIGVTGTLQSSPTS